MAGRLRIGRGVQGLPEFGALAHPIAVTADGDETAMVNEPIDERRRHDLATEDLATLQILYWTSAPSALPHKHASVASLSLVKEEEDVARGNIEGVTPSPDRKSHRSRAKIV